MKSGSTVKSHASLTQTDWARVRSAGDYVWDGKDQDDKPLSQTELNAALATAKRGRPKAAVTKTPVKLRLDPDLLSALRDMGRGWQTQVNAYLRSMVFQHTSTRSPSKLA